MCEVFINLSLLYPIQGINYQSFTSVSPILCLMVSPFITTFINRLIFFPSDKLKDAIIAKIAMQAADLYADAYSNMQVGAVKQMWDKVPGHVIFGMRSCD